MKTRITILLLVLFSSATAQIEITPKTMIASFSGIVHASHQLNASEKQTAFGVYSIGIPSWTPSLSIKDKFYIGGALGLEVGAGFDKENVALLLRIPLGFSAGYQVNDESFVQVKYYLLSQTGTFLQGGSDDGWVYTGSFRYKNFILDLSKSVGGTTGGGFLKGRMDYNFFQIFPKYAFEFKEKVYWVGVRYESFKGTSSEPSGLDRASNAEFLFGKLLSW